MGRATAPGEPWKGGRKGGRAPAGGGRAALRAGAGRGGAARSLCSAPDRGPLHRATGSGCARGRGPGGRSGARGTSAAGGRQPRPAGGHAAEPRAAPRLRAAGGCRAASAGTAGRPSVLSRSAGPLPAGGRLLRRTAEPASPRGCARLQTRPVRRRAGLLGRRSPGCGPARFHLGTAARPWLRAHRYFRGKRTEAAQLIPAAHRTVL